ncbi:MAG: hypothetical protein M5U01_03415 [Ardenticatenaceae bacterium]|nr:hypothetical protein [Ardenticatenaceae bacterium]HBY98065.1 hypothetical protein [Chloroflexota bacterium]
MSTRQIALAAVLLAIVFLAHAAGRFTQIGGAQLAPSIAIYVLMALLIAPELGWGPLVGIGLATGILTMLATSSPFPPANIPAHGLAFLAAAYLTKLWVKDREASTGQIVAIAAVTLVVSWTLFALFTWLGLAGSPFTARAFARFGMAFGQGFTAWWLFGFVGVAIPTFIVALILTPLLYRVVRPALVRQGMLAVA